MTYRFNVNGMNSRTVVPFERVPINQDFHSQNG